MRNHNPGTVYMNISTNHTPEMRYNGEGDFFEWQAKARAKLVELP